MRKSLKKLLMTICGLAASGCLIVIGYVETIGPANPSRSEYIMDHAVNLQGHPEAKTSEQNDNSGSVILK